LLNNASSSGNESSLHSAIKKCYFLEGDRLEARVEDFVVEIIRGDLLIEVKTANLSSIKSKLLRLLDAHKVRLVYSIPRTKWIVRRLIPNGEISGRRRSPKKIWCGDGRGSWRRKGASIEDRHLIRVFERQIFECKKWIS
jgi:hypothetical protein